MFLSEIEHLPLALQEILLSLLTTEVPSGSIEETISPSESAPFAVRLLASTSADLQLLVHEGRFSEPLYELLRQQILVIPPLRHRRSDLTKLADQYLAHFAKLHGYPGAHLSQDAYEGLQHYHWPGNDCQFRNIIETAVILSRGKEIVAEHLNLQGNSDQVLQSLRIEDWERHLIDEALSRTGGNIPQAAKLLGIGRATLYRKIENRGNSA